MTATTTGGITCAKCQTKHPTVADVRACQLGPVVARAEAAAAAGRRTTEHVYLQDGTLQQAVSSVPQVEQIDPAYGAAPAGPAVRPASEKQVAFLTRLVAERLDSEALQAAGADYVALIVAQGARYVSAEIDRLLKLPKVTAAPAVALEAGVYVTPEGRTYRVYLGQRSGQLLAAEVVGDAFEYAGKADRFVKAGARKLTIEEAAAFGKATGTCIVCARRLDVPESVDRGIGPTCYAAMGG